MTVEKLAKEKTYIVLETDGTDTRTATISDSEWSAVEAIFENHPELIKIWCPYREPELIEELAQIRARNE